MKYQPLKISLFKNHGTQVVRLFSLLILILGLTATVNAQSKLQYDAAYDISKAVFNSFVLDVTSQDGRPREILFNDDGTKLYVLGASDDDIIQYDLSTAYDISTAAYNSDVLNISSQENIGNSMLFNDDGTIFYMMGEAGEDINQYDLSTAYDISTAVFINNILDVAPQDTSPTSMLFNDDGTILYILGETGKDINQYDLSTAYDISTAVFINTILDVSPQDTAPTSIIFNDDGTILYLIGEGTRSVYHYDLSTAYDISTAAYNSLVLDVSADGLAPRGMLFNNDGTRLYVVDDFIMGINQYDMPGLGNYEEAVANDGSIDNSSSVPQVITLSGGDTFTGTNGDDLVALGKVTIGNVPAGLTAVLTKVSDTEVTLTFTGNAVNHQDIDDVASLTFVFLDAAFTGGDAAAVTDSGDGGAVSKNIPINFNNNPSDYGDAPDSYSTLLASGGATHFTYASPTVYLGATAPDTDTDGFGDGTDDNGNASDDDTEGTADEDGATIPASIEAGQSYSIPVTTTGAGTLHTWIDWNADGDFADAGETLSPIASTGGAETVSGTAPISPNFVAGTSYVRFRYTSDTSFITTPTFDGPASDGEVEDYQIVLEIDPCDPASGNPDTDGDGVTDECDLDDDNDGILDIKETDCQSGPAQFVLGTDSFGGSLTLPFSGGSANWTINITGYSSMRYGGLSDNNELSYVFDGPSGYDIIADFSISSIPPDTDLQLVLYGYVDADSRVPAFFNKTFFGSIFGKYTISWVGGAGDATLFDPAGQIIGGGRDIVNGGFFEQDMARGNNSLRWYIIFPKGATDFTFTAEDGFALEGFRFSAIENSCLDIDTDNDSIPNHLDLDSDNDGISDLQESGDLAGIALDVNNDGTVSLSESTDTDSDGIMDIYEDGNLTTNTGTTPAESADDADTIPNYLDLDSDGDGIPDTIEARPSAGYITNDGNVSDNDADGDGIIDIFDPNDADGVAALFGGTFVLEDTDNDGTPDYLDIDSDGDTISDATESGLTLSATDANDDGIDDAIGASYTDPDGAVNAPLGTTSGLKNVDGNPTDVDFRSLFTPPMRHGKHFMNGKEQPMYFGKRPGN